MKKPPFVSPIPWRDALHLFPEYAAKVLEDMGSVFLSNATEVFPCKTDGFDIHGRPYLSFLTLHHDPTEPEPFSLQRQDFWLSGGADGDTAGSFDTREDALANANQELQEGGYILDEQEEDDGISITAIGDKVTVTERRLSLAEQLDKAIASARASELDIRIALGEAAHDPSYITLYDLLEPAVKIGQRLTHLRSFVKDEAPAPEATYPEMSVSDLVDKGAL